MGCLSKTPAVDHPDARRAACQRGTADALPASGEDKRQSGSNRCLLVRWEGVLMGSLITGRGQNLRSLPHDSKWRSEPIKASSGRGVKAASQALSPLGILCCMQPHIGFSPIHRSSALSDD